MIKYQFVNKDTSEIQEMLKKIGKVRFEYALDHAGLSRPMKMQNFKLISRMRVAHLMYKTDMGFTSIMILKDYELPAKGWELEKYRG